MQICPSTVGKIGGEIKGEISRGEENRRSSKYREKHFAVSNKMVKGKEEGGSVWEQRNGGKVRIEAPLVFIRAYLAITERDMDLETLVFVQ